MPSKLRIYVAHILPFVALTGIVVAIGCLMPRLSTAEAGDSAPSVRFDLSRGIHADRYVLVHEQRLAQTVWAAYLYKVQVEGHEKFCAQVGSMLERRYFAGGTECGGLWPDGNTGSPVFGFVKRVSFTRPFSSHPGRSPELFGMFLLSRDVRMISIRLAGGTDLRRQVHRMPARYVKFLSVSQMNYATVSIQKARRIVEITAFDANGAELRSRAFPKG